MAVLGTKLVLAAFLLCNLLIKVQEALRVKLIPLQRCLNISHMPQSLSFLTIPAPGLFNILLFFLLILPGGLMLLLLLPVLL
jgi:hypothetical protein